MENRALILFTKKLTGELSDSEARELNHLLSAHPELHDELQVLESIWTNNNETVADNLDADFERLVARMHQQGMKFDAPIAIPSTETPARVVRFRKPAKMLAWIAGAAAVFFSMVWLFSESKAELPESAAVAKANQVSTRPGSRTKIQLPDGTQVWLNADSKLTYDNDFGITSREVTLIGEAYFDVVSNKKVPFYIHTSSIKVKVTGTAFNVRAYPGETITETSLIRGKVEVTLNSSPDKTYYLRPREKLIVSDNMVNDSYSNAEGVMAKQSRIDKAVELPTLKKLVYNAIDSIPVETAWVNNKLAFTDESFREVADKMERWYGLQIVFAAPELETIRFTGRFENESVSNALEAMQYTAKFKFLINGNTIIISKSTK